MKEVLVKHPQVAKYAVQGNEKSRNKTDNASYSWRHRWFTIIIYGSAMSKHICGRTQLPLTAGMGCVQDMEMAVKVIVEIAKIWEKRS